MSNQKNFQSIQFRQGDVFIESVNAIPDVATVQSRGKRDLVLQEGEVTGHAHRICSRHAKLYRTEMDARFMRVTAPVALTHEEHSTVTIPPGDYRISIHAEYQPGELPRQVED